MANGGQLAQAIPCKGYKSNKAKCAQQTTNADGWCRLCKYPDAASAGVTAGAAPSMPGAPSLLEQAAAAMPVTTPVAPADVAVQQNHSSSIQRRRRLTDQEQILLDAMESGTPVILWGNPGIGKTETIKSIARDNDFHIEVVVAAIYEPADIGGQQYVVDANGRPKLTHLVPPWAERIMEASERGQRSVLFFDELDKAAIANQNASLRVIRERVVADMQLPEDTIVVAAANPPEQGGWDLTAPMANRFLHMDWKIDEEAVREGLGTGMWGGRPNAEEENLDQEMRDARLQVRALVAGFLHRNPSHMHSMPKDDTAQGRAWASPRTWEHLIHTLAAAKVRGATAHQQQQIIMGCIGQGAGMEFATYQDSLDLPDPEDIIKDPENAEIPDRGDKLFVALSAVGSAVLHKQNAERTVAALKYLDRVCAAGKGDSVIAACRPFIKSIASPELQKDGLDILALEGIMQNIVRVARDAHVLDQR